MIIEKGPDDNKKGVPRGAISVEEIKQKVTEQGGVGDMTSHKVNQAIDILNNMVNDNGLPVSADDYIKMFNGNVDLAKEVRRLVEGGTQETKTPSENILDSEGTMHFPGEAGNPEASNTMVFSPEMGAPQETMMVSSGVLDELPTKETRAELDMLETLVDVGKWINSHKNIDSISKAKANNVISNIRTGVQVKLTDVPIALRRVVLKLARKEGLNNISMDGRA